MKIYKTALALGLAATFMITGNAFATTTTYTDNWINWPGYSSSLGDENGTPKIKEMIVTVSDTGLLTDISIILNSNQFQAYDSLFINTYNNTTTNTDWDDWDYFVHDGGNSHDGYTEGTVAADGLYSVNQDYAYTYVKDRNRIGNPNGIDASSLTLLYGSYGADHSDSVIAYTGLNIDVSKGYFIAYAPWCDNDIIGGGTAPVPEPATMLLFGTGLAGLAGFRRKRFAKA